MQKGKILNRQRLMTFSILIVFAVSLCSTFLGFMPRAYAADPSNFAMYVGDSPETKKAIAKTWDDKHDSYDDAGWQQIQIYSKSLFGQDGATVNFDADHTKQMACVGGGPLLPDECESREPVFTKQYFCTLPDHKIAFTKPGADKEFYEIWYAIGLQDNGQKGEEFTARDTFKATGGVILTKVNRLTDAGFSKEEKAYDITEGNKTPPDIDNGDNGNEDGHGDKFGIDNVDQACRPGPDLVGSMNIQNYDKLSPTDKKQFAKAAAAGPGGSSAGGEDDIPNCENTGSVSGFILCPFIEGLSAVADTIFESVIKGFLENIPISADPDDGGYKAWQAFRVLGNIVLIGSMLGIVYYQTRGGG